MLSFIYNLVNTFEASHAIRPNLLYVSEAHLHHLVSQFSKDYDLIKIMDFLDMEIIIDNEAVHPHVAWTRIVESKTAIC